MRNNRLPPGHASKNNGHAALLEMVRGLHIRSTLYLADTPEWEHIEVGMGLCLWSTEMVDAAAWNMLTPRSAERLAGCEVHGPAGFAVRRVKVPSRFEGQATTTMSLT
ncbi:hypothetical protein FA13DRAFT_1733948 [Coprinellus micaceus]|uniref:Uncharacterized protein n=1 Tax=Coprinellus micaceus TaxID=71717 RepID=A0A4Y7T810_COPMI|nr:hypothetical protein FA13DRAFT_1733948 [Coprinellus micaceus]